MSRRQRWCDMSGRRRASIVALSVVQVGLQLAALIDLWRRPAEKVRGDKRVWAAVTFVNFAGPIAYFARGRER